MTPKIIELIIQDGDEQAGLDGIALVEMPAHEAKFEYFNQKDEPTRYVLQDEDVEPAIKMFSSFGEPQGLLESEGWNIVSVEQLGHRTFASITSQPNQDSPIYDTDEYRVRFKYVGPSDEKNREFCADMMRLRRVFRMEDILEMSRENVNPIGPSGYDLMTWRGSYNCRHGWVKLIYSKDGVIINNDKVRKGVISQEDVPGPDTRTEATIAAGNTPPRTFSKCGCGDFSNPDVSALSPYVEQITDEVEKKPVLASLPMFPTKEDAEAFAPLLNCEGAHEMDYQGQKLWMPCSEHFADELEDACWEGYEPIGLKEKDGKMVPNCVPVDKVNNAQQFKTYNDYPEAAKNNACKVLKWRDEHGDEVQGMTRVGWTRANQLCKGENISEDTIARMSAFQRHRKNADVSAENKSTPWKDAGYVAWLGWGGTTGVEWASRKLQSIRKEMSFSVLDTEERILLGPAMIPDKMIIRRNEITGDIYYVYFTAETIKKLQQKFMQEKLLDATNLEHGRKFLKNVDVVESWIVEDPIYDKQKTFGMEYPKGTWMISMKVNDDEVWKKVKNGQLRGFSVQGYFLERAKFNSQPNNILQEIKEILKDIK